MPGRRHPLAPSRRAQTRRQVGQRSEHEQTLLSLGVGHLEESGRPGRIRVCIDGPAGRWSIDRQACPAEHQQVEVELARAPATADLPAERSLEVLERDEQRGRPRRRIGTGGDIESSDRIQEVRLIDDPDRPRGVQPGHPAESDAGQDSERVDRGRGRRSGVADVGTETDVRPSPPRPRHRALDLRPSRRHR